MKKTILITLLIVIFACYSGCGESMQSSAAPEETPYEIKTKYYEIYEVTKHGRPAYQYFIFGSYSHLDFDRGIVYGFPQVTESDGIIKLCVKVDTGVSNCRYFDIESKLSSIWFVSPVAENGTLVAYPDQPWEATKLIVQNIFDKSKYYCEFEREFTYIYTPIESAEFINDDKQLHITYETGQEKQEVTEILDLY